jgi:hypothetical protein
MVVDHPAPVANCWRVGALGSSGTGGTTGCGTPNGLREPVVCVTIPPEIVDPFALAEDRMGVEAGL